MILLPNCDPWIFLKTRHFLLIPISVRGVCSMRGVPPSAPTDPLYRSREEIRELQNRRFRHQIDLCFRAHPYYQGMFRRLKLAIEDFQTVEDVQKLPVTTKQDYLSDPEAFRLTALP